MFKSMSKLSDAQERDAVDSITDCMYSIAYLVEVSNHTFSEKRDSITLGKFYDMWFRATGSNRQKPIIPFSQGVYLGYMYVGILHAKENWFDLLPNDPILKCDEDWGLRGVSVVTPKEPNPTVSYVVRRIRNSLGHARPIYRIPAGISRGELFTKSTYSFHDVLVVNKQETGDTFDVTLTMDQINKFIKKFQSVIHRHVREKL